MVKKLERYVGARPFETENQLIFRGRQSDTEGVFQLIQLEQSVVLYGKSGTGKSSLLNAGIIPKVKADTTFDPIRVRFYAYKEGNEFLPPIDSARQAVRGSAAHHTTFLDKLIANEATLWHDVKEHFIRHKGERGLLLVIDQFEELFTYPESFINDFQSQMAEALFKAVPQRYWDILQKQYALGNTPLSKEELTLLQKNSALKIVLSIRSDRLHLLKRLDAHLPNLDKHHYELEALSDTAAKQAIQEPAAMPQMDIFDTPPFLYDPTTLDYILDFLTHERKGAAEADDALTDAQRQKIEATQLQIICSAVERKVKAKPNLQVVQIQDVGNLEAIIADYYDNQIQNLPTDQQLPARRLIEEGLVFEEEERRLSLYEGQIFKTYKILPDTLRQLVDSHLLRAEPSLNGGYTYELSHDTLVAPVIKAKNSRLEAERKAAEAQAKQERDAELAAAKRQADIEKRRRQRSNLALAVAIIGLAFAYWQYREAENAKKTAESAQQVAEIERDNAQKATLTALKSDRSAKLSRDNALLQKTVAEHSDSIAQTATKQAKTQLINANAALAKVKIAEADKYIQSAKRLKDLDPPLTKQILEAAQRLLSEAEKLDKSNKDIATKQLEINVLK